MSPHAEHPLVRALPLFLFGGLCLCTLDTTAKYLIRDHSLFIIVWARYAGQLLVVTPWAWHRAGPGFWRTRRLKLHMQRSATLLAATICFFSGLRYLPLAEGSAIVFLGPMMLVLLAGPMLGERPGRARILAAICSFAGVLIMLRPGSAIFHPAVLLLLGAAFANALYYVLTRKLADEDVRTTLFYTALVGAATITPLLPWGVANETFTLRDVGFLLLLGLLAGAGHWAHIHAYALAPASMLGPFTYVQMLWATGYGYLVFQQIPDGISALGMAVILASGVLLALHEGNVVARLRRK